MQQPVPLEGFFTVKCDHCSGAATLKVGAARVCLAHVHVPNQNELLWKMAEANAK